MNVLGLRRVWLSVATVASMTWCGLANGAIAEIAATTAGSANATATTLSIAVPAGVVANDVLLVQISAGRTGETITPPTGWTAIRSDNQAYLAVGITQTLFYRVATGTEAASYAFGLSSAAGVAGSMIDFRGVDTGAPILGNGGQGGAALIDTAPAIASCQAGTVQVAFYGFSTGLLSLTLGGGLTPYASNTTSTLVGVTIASGGATMSTAGTCPAYTAIAVSLTANVGQQVALTPAQSAAGTVYGDANHDGTLGGGETGIGQTTYVKLASGTPGACQSPALQVATANASSGAYSFATVNAGSYCLIASTNATLSDVTSTIPSGFVRTETPTGVRALTVTTTAATAQNFGLYAGSTLAGRVFTDNGAGGGTANDGIVNGTEAGIASTIVNVVSGSTTIATATTDAGGNYTAWIPSTASGTLSVVQPVAASSLAVSGAAGTTGGSYARATNATSFTYTAGQTWTAVNFGNVPQNTLSNTGAQTVGPGGTVPYAHVFIAGTAGTVTFGTSASSTPSAAWTQTLVQDTNCNGVADTGEPLVTAPIVVTAGQTVCLIVKDTMPAGVTNGAVDVVTLTASMAYANANPAFTQAVTRTDMTTVSTATLLQLSKAVKNTTQGGSFTTSNTAAPNDTLVYQLTVTNPASAGVSTIVINDASPAYTGFVSAACPGTLPTGVTGCTVSAQPAAGAQGTVQWTYAGTLAGGASLVMTYQVTVSQ